MEHYKNLSLEDIKGEIWKDVVGYENLYKVSSLGRIKSLSKKRGAFDQEERIKTQEYSNGYLRCNLHKNGISRKQFTHRIVAQSFIPNTLNKPQIDHINRNRADNRVENLRWCTAKENVMFNDTYKCRKEAMRKMNADPKVKEKKHNTSCCKKVIQEDLDGNIICVYRSAAEVFRVLGYNVSAQCRMLYKTKYKNRPFKFRYYNPDKDGLLIAEYARRKNL